MQNLRFLLKPKYENSYALLIGINKYVSAQPLSYAVNDAEEMKKVIIEDLKFKEENVTLLCDENATKANILQCYLQFAQNNIQTDDRIIIFYAGHGHTKSGFRGEVGYLVPYDADMNDISSFIRWDEFTLNSELIRAKHMLFIMDACYGGLALTRSLCSGSTRFLKDMLLRYSRQVLTAGKADEVVSDSGGPIPNHSVFTGHLIQGIKGNAFSDPGILTANGLMSYVYSKVANDKNSNQTPHYGYFDGDGDFILFAPDDRLASDSDTILVIPFAKEEPTRINIEEKITKVKSLLSNDASSIELHDYLIEEERRFLNLTTDDNFQIQGNFDVEEFLTRIERYEQNINDLSILTACVTYWAKPIHFQLLQKLFARSTDRLVSTSGLVAWLYLRWYPIILMLYSAGISAIDNSRYDSLSAIFFTKIVSPENGDKDVSFIEAIGNCLHELQNTNMFSNLPGHEKNRVPMSEYLFKTLQPKLDDMLFLGKNYERAFDRFEVLLALLIADNFNETKGHVWGPIGRFGYKNGFDNQGPLNQLINEGKNYKNNWPIIKAGFFGGDYSRFEIVSTEFTKRVNNLQWY